MVTSLRFQQQTYGRLNFEGNNTNLNGDGDISEGSQLTLPRVIVDNFTVGDILPEGFIYLRDNVTGKLYSDAVYEYNNPQTVVVKNAELDTAHGFSIITTSALQLLKPFTTFVTSGSITHMMEPTEKHQFT